MIQWEEPAPKPLMMRSKTIRDLVEEDFEAEDDFIDTGKFNAKKILAEAARLP
jgi:hypothetical protein